MSEHNPSQPSQPNSYFGIVETNMVLSMHDKCELVVVYLGAVVVVVVVALVTIVVVIIGVVLRDVIVAVAGFDDVRDDTDDVSRVVEVDDVVVSRVVEDVVVEVVLRVVVYMCDTIGKFPTH